MDNSAPETARPRVWAVGALCRAVADALDLRFNPVRVSGELLGFSRASSGHCYFSIKDSNGQLRCAMFRRAAGLLDFVPRDGDAVELWGRLALYEPRGELQLVVERLTRAGPGSLFEQFIHIKQRLEREGLFEAARKRPLRALPACVGVVTSLGAAALQDVLAALKRRAPYVVVLIAPCAVQGENAPAELVAALQSLYHRVHAPGSAPAPQAILLVRGGGSMEDLWAFNDETLARTIAQSPVPVVSGVGHETDFTIADFVADVRAPTPTAAAELVAASAEAGLLALAECEQRLRAAARRRLERDAQGLDHLAERASRPSVLMERRRSALASWEQSLHRGLRAGLQAQQRHCDDVAQSVQRLQRQALERALRQCENLDLRLRGVSPQRTLARGYAWLQDEGAKPLVSVAQIQPGQRLQATLVDGTVDTRVTSVRRI